MEWISSLLKILGGAAIGAGVFTLVNDGTINIVGGTMTNFTKEVASDIADEASVK